MRLEAPRDYRRLHQTSPSPGFLMHWGANVNAQVVVAPDQDVPTTFQRLWTSQHDQHVRVTTQGRANLSRQGRGRLRGGT